MHGWCLPLALLTFLAISTRNPIRADEGGGQTLTVSSPAFADGAMIPAKYTCDGANVSPPLAWSGVPAGTKSLALLCEDPDAPSGTWVHWVIFNLPASTSELPENVPPEKTLANGARQGKNDFGKIGYGGPAPPRGEHRYVFELYALDAMLDLAGGAARKQLLRAMEGHVLAEGRLTGRYKRR